ncbi:MAG: hypothetical protein ABI249_01240 [Ornithinibacter sp.]
MAPRLTQQESASSPEPGRLRALGGVTPGLRIGLLLVSTALLLLVGLSAPNAAQTDLSPRGWAPGTLVPLTLGPGAVTAVLWTAYGLAGLAVFLGFVTRPGALRSWRVPGVLAAAALLTAPFGSADHVNYLAYGRILVGGGNPWTDSPVDWAGGLDPVTSRVEAPWTTEPSVYGPFGTLLHGLSSWLGGDTLRQGVWVWQVLVVIAWLAVRWLLRLTLERGLHGRVDVLWTLNPLVFGVGVLGAHIDVVAAALAVAAIAIAARGGVRSAVGAGVLVGLGGSTKFTYAVVAVGIVVAWWVVGHRRARLAALVGSLVTASVVVVGGLQVWAGPHVYDQLQRSSRAVSLATPWRLFLEAAGPSIGFGTARLVISVGAALLAVGLAASLLLLSRPASRHDSDPLVDGSHEEGQQEERTTGPDAVGVVALWVTACLALAYSLAASYSLPWYDVLAWSALPALVSGLVDKIALVRLIALAAAYVPGRVLGMSQGVEDLTLGVRREVVPWVVLGLWLVVLSAGARSALRMRRGPRRAGRPPSPTR